MHPGLVLHRPQELQLPPQANPHPLHGALAPVGEAEPDTGGGEAEKAAAKLGMPPLPGHHTPAQCCSQLALLPTQNPVVLHLEEPHPLNLGQQEFVGAGGTGGVGGPGGVGGGAGGNGDAEGVITRPVTDTASSVIFPEKAVLFGGILFKGNGPPFAGPSTPL